MSSNLCAHINVHDKEGRFHQIFDVKGVRHFNPTDEEKEHARSVARERYDNYRDAELHVMHYDRNGYNDKNNVVKL